MATNDIEKTLARLNLSVFSTSEFSQLSKMNPASARSFLARSSKRKDSHIVKLKRGVYLFLPNLTTELEIANKLHQPSYISFETALSYYNIIPEIVYAITSATTKRSTEIVAKNSLYKYLKIKKGLYFGYRPIKIKNKTIMMAEPEKALLDYVYILSLKKRNFNERIDLTKINIQKLKNYINYFGKVIKKNKAFVSLINQIYKSL